MPKKRIGIIGGSGFYDIQDMPHRERVTLSTPFGLPSDALEVFEIDGRETVFLPRHGKGHRILPTDINYRANIYALKKMDVEWIVSISAVGSFKKEIKPLDIVLIDQFVDRTTQRRSTFFGEGIVAHIGFAEPICQNLRRILYEAGQEEGVGARIHWGGTYLNMEGPAFSTRAESLIHQSWGCDVVGMTNATEAKLAREAEICYATIAMVTDYDTWLGDAKSMVSVQIIIDNLRKNVSTTQKIIRNALQKIGSEDGCGCHSAMKDVILTSQELIPDSTKEKLFPLIGKYFK